MPCRENQSCRAGQAGLKHHDRSAGALQDRALTWVDMVGFYPAPEECLAAFLVASAAEVLAGVKPANLIRILKRQLPCGRCMHSLWEQYGEALLADSSLEALPLREDQDGVLLLLYRPELLEVRLKGRTMRAFLRRRGYPDPQTIEGTLEHLQRSFLSADSPDEVGVFLGYPVKDVNGFMARRKGAWEGRCLWRIYGPPGRSLKLYQWYCRERRAVTEKLISGYLPQDLLCAA